MARLSGILPVIVEALETGTVRANEFFKRHGKAVNRQLFPSLVRYFAGEHLSDEGHVIDELDREVIGNIGLSMKYRERRIRIWKADGDTLPAPGTSNAKSGFLNQQLAWDFRVPESPTHVDFNLVVLWNVDHKFRLSGMHLALPESAELAWTPAKAHWVERIPIPFVEAPAVPDEMSVDDTYDLPFESAEPDTEEDVASGK
jgi:hypothetical protein